MAPAPAPTHDGRPDGPRAPGRGWLWGAVVLAALLGTAGILTDTARYGAGITPDSVDYVAAARHLLAGEGVTNAEGRPIVLWPPLFPLALAAGGALGLDPAVGARWLNAACFGLVLLLSGGWLVTRVAAPWVVLTGLGALLFSPMVVWFGFAWSEPLFMVLLLMGLRDAERYEATGSPAALARLGGWTALAAVTRYPGAVLAPLGLVLIALRPGTWAERARRVALLLVVSASLPLLWGLRNWRLSGTLTGDRGTSPTGLMANAQAALGVMSGWFVPPGDVSGWVPVLATAALALAAALAGWGLWRSRGRWGADFPVAVGLFVALYPALVVAARATSGQGQMEDRYLLPALPPLVMGLAWGLDRAAARRGRAFGLALAASLGVWLVAFPVLRTVSFAGLCREQGAGGYATRYWQDRHMVHFLKTADLGTGAVWSSMPDLVYWTAGRTADFTPRAGELDTETGRKRVAERLAAALAPGRPVYLVWIPGSGRAWLEGEAALTAALDLKPVVGMRDGSGTVFRVASATVRPPRPEAAPGATPRTDAPGGAGGAAPPTSGPPPPPSG